MLRRAGAQSNAAPTVVDDKRLVLLGDRRQADDLPILLRQHVADQIVLVQPVHDQDDRPCCLSFSRL